MMTDDRWPVGEQFRDDDQPLENARPHAIDARTVDERERRVVETARYWTPLGWLTAGAHDGGVFAIAFAEETAQAEVGRATDGGGAGRLLKLLGVELEAYFAGEPRGFTVPLDIGAGTEFQRQVWTALQRIPRGAITTYGEIAAGLGCPGASRAVGRANGANPLAIVIPCHRVVPKGGTVGGYGGGRWRKERLLELEGACLPLGHS